MRYVEIPGGRLGISEPGDPVHPYVEPGVADPQIQVSTKGNCAKAKARPVERCKAIRPEAPATTHTISVTIDGILGRIPFIPDR